MEEKIMLDIFSKRLTALVNEHNNMPFLMEKLGIKSKSTIYRYMNAQMSPKLPTVKAIAEIYNVDPVWLLGYDVPMKKQKDEIDNNIFPLPDNVVSIPVVGKISAGIPLLAVENIVKYEYAPSSYIKDGHTYFYLTVQGDSMDRKFHDGDLILVQKQDDLENDEIGVILINDEATVKKYKKENDLITLHPMSFNPIHEAHTYNPKKINIKVIGKVISYQGRI